MRRMLMSAAGLVLVFAVNGMGQISILTNTYLPAAGTEVITYNDANANAALLTTLSSGTGGPMTWDLTGRTYAGQNRAVVVSTASTPAIASYPGANLVLMTPLGADSVWSVHRSVAASFYRMGTVLHSSAVGQVVTVYSDSAPDFVFPLQYGNQWTSYRHWRQNSPSTYTDTYDSTFNSVDAWGTVKYGGTTISVLRVSSVERMTQKAYLTATDSLVYTLLGTYNWVQLVASNFTMPLTAYKYVSSGNTYYGCFASTALVGQPTAVDENRDDALPTGYALDQNFPNPFNPTTEVAASLPVRSHVKLTVFNITGQEVKVLADREMGPGAISVVWDGTNDAGRAVSSGTYFYRLEAGDFVATKKMVLLK